MTAIAELKEGDAIEWSRVEGWVPARVEAIADQKGKPVAIISRTDGKAPGRTWTISESDARATIRKLADVRGLEWVRGQLEDLIKSAEDNIREDTASLAEAHSDEREKYETRVEAERHHAKQLRRVLDGKTWDEAFVEAARAAATNERRRR